jgi:putative aldouronate transport system substrate-binding protein
MNQKRVLIGVAILALVATLCGASATQEEASGDATTEDVAQISILSNTNWPIPGEVDVNDNRWANVFKEGLPDIEIDWIIVPGSNVQEKKNILIATGDIPDVMPCDDMEMVQWAEQGIIQPVDEYIADYFPNQAKWVSEEVLEYAYYDGRQYRILMPKSSLENPTTLYVRSDWLEALDAEVPTTVDEAFELMRAFTSGDPDGNGVDDTYGVIGRSNLESMSWAFNAFGVQDGFWSDVDGEIVPDIVRPEMKDALAFIRELYDSGVYYKDSLVLQTHKQVEDVVTQGTIGFTESPPSNGVANRVKPALQEVGMDMVPVAPLAGPDGTRMYASTPGIWWKGSNAVASTSEHPEAAVRVFNWLLEERTDVEYNSINADRIINGTPGVHSEVITPGNFLKNIARSQLTAEQDYEVYRLSYTICGSYGHMADYETIASYRGNGDAILAVAPYAHYSDKVIVGPKEAEMLGELKTYFDELKMQIITGQAPVDAFDEWVEYFYANGGDEIVEEANAFRN